MRRGFTLVELLMVLALFSLILAMGAGLSFPYYRRQQVITAAQVAASELRMAQTEAESQLDDAAHGVKAQTSGMVRFTGSSYASRTTSKDKTSLFSFPVTVSGTTEFVFPKGDVAPQSAGTLTLTLDDLAIDIAVSSYGLLTVSRRTVTP